jgi:hypothetical protein
MITAIKMNIPKELQVAFNNPSGFVQERFSRGILESAIHTQGKIKDNVHPGWGMGYDAGAAGNFFTGRLNRNILSEMVNPLKARVGVSESVPYGAIQEYGGIIRPVTAKALFVPTSVRGRKVGPVKGGGSGLIYGEDFIFMQKVTIKPKTYFARGIQTALSGIEKIIGMVVYNLTKEMGFK